MGNPNYTSSDHKFAFLIEKVLVDRDFAQALADDSRSALESIGITPTDDMVNALDNLDKEAIVSVARKFSVDPGVYPFGC